EFLLLSFLLIGFSSLLLYFSIRIEHLLSLATMYMNSLLHFPIFRYIHSLLLLVLHHIVLHLLVFDLFSLIAFSQSDSFLATHHFLLLYTNLPIQILTKLLVLPMLLYLIVAFP